MSDPKDPPKTVFMPSGAGFGDEPGASPAGADAPAPGSTAAEDDWFSGESSAASAPPEAAPEPAPPPSSWADAEVAPAPPTPPPIRPSTSTPSGPAGEGRIAVGMTLNHIFEVRRFIARGGMGEVYEGVNVNTDERVAIKVILSHLARDPNVQAMFRKEARTLTRLQHPALVQYRVLAEEPSLSVLYIVTEYIDGLSLGDIIGKVRPTADELIGLTRRLAAGLQVAHELGAIHRDIAPDNVLLPEGKLDHAKIIDFGIAKDLDPSNKTIVGDGFAGKLGFVAPEQFGDYNREIGPWTDVYSLALVILSIAAGRPIDMGATLVDAIDKRRKGPDLSSAPEPLRGVLGQMLKPDPAERLRSMKEVLEALDGAPAAPTAAPSLSAKGKPGAKGGAASPTQGKMPMIIGGGVALVLLLGVAAFFLSRPSKTAPGAAGGATAAVQDSEKVRRAVETSLPSIACTWIDIDGISQDPAGVSIRLSGVAGSPVAAQQAVTAAAKSAGATVSVVDASNVFPVGPQSCAPLDTFRPLREANSEMGRRFTSQQSSWELSAKNDPCSGPNAKVVVQVAVNNPQQDFSILGLDKTGGLQQIFANRQKLKDFQTQFPDFVTDKGGDKFDATSCYNETGLVGQLLLTGQGPFDVDLPSALESNKSRQVDQAWLTSFTEKAKARGWRTNMVWYRVVDDQPG